MRAKTSEPAGSQNKKPGALAAHTAGGILLFQASTFAAALLIARTLGPAGQGRFQLLVALSALLVTFISLGLDEATSYTVPRFQVLSPGKVGGVVWYSILVTVAMGAVAGLLIYAGSDRLAVLVFNDPTLQRDIGYSLFLVPAMMLVTVGAGILRGLGRSDLRSLVYYYLVGPGFLVVIAYLALHGLTLGQVELVRVASYAIAGALAVVLIAKVLHHQPRNLAFPDAADIQSLHRLGASLILVRLSQYVLEQPTIDVLLVGHLATAAAAGVYYAAAKVGLVVSLGLATLTIVVAPILSQAVARDDREGLVGAYSWAATWMAILGALIGGGLIVLRHDVLALFGERYLAGQGILVTFAIGQILAALLGPNTPLLIATGRVKIEILLTAAFAVSMVLGGLLIGELFGPMGVAYASAGCFLLLAVSRYVICARRYSLPPLQKSLKVLLVGVVAGIVGEGAHRLAPFGEAGVAVASGALFLIVFAVLAYLLSAIPSFAFRPHTAHTPANE